MNTATISNHTTINRTASTILQRMGAWAFPRYCRSIGIDFDTTYFLMFGRFPTR